MNIIFDNNILCMVQYNMYKTYFTIIIYKYHIMCDCENSISQTDGSHICT